MATSKLIEPPTFFRGSQEVADCQDDECIYLFRCSLSEIDPFTNAQIRFSETYGYIYWSNNFMPDWAIKEYKTDTMYWNITCRAEIPPCLFEK